MVYLLGEPGKADVRYVSFKPGDAPGAGFPVNSRPGSAVAAGTIRGAHVAVDGNGRPHVAWNGAGDAQPAPPLPPGADAAAAKFRSPMLYSRLSDDGKTFEPQRNLMTRSYTLDGGGSIAADGRGGVFVAWHAHVGEGPKGEEGRRVWLARSTDGGANFSAERAVFGAKEGACACCGLRTFAAADGAIYAIYRSAFETVHRDVYLLRSADRGETFSGERVHEWEIGACPMSSMHFVEHGDRVWVAWETAGQIWFAPADRTARPVSAPGDGGRRKHPRMALDSAGRMLLTWTSVAGWAKAGELGWALYDPSGKLETSGGGEAAPVWSFAAPVARPGGFDILV
jgi:hypothetical protein